MAPYLPTTVLNSSVSIVPCIWFSLYRRRRRRRRLPLIKKSNRTFITSSPTGYVQLPSRQHQVSAKLVRCKRPFLIFRCLDRCSLMLFGNRRILKRSLAPSSSCWSLSRVGACATKTTTTSRLSLEPSKHSVAIEEPQPEVISNGSSTDKASNGATNKSRLEGSHFVLQFDCQIWTDKIEAGSVAIKEEKQEIDFSVSGKHFRFKKAKLFCRSEKT